MTPATLAQDGDHVTLREIGADMVEDHFPIGPDFSEIGFDLLLVGAFAGKAQRGISARHRLEIDRIGIEIEEGIVDFRLF
jgi:hypothetical protein